MDVLTFETCWAVNSEIIKQVTSSWSIFIKLMRKSAHLVGIAHVCVYRLFLRYIRSQQPDLFPYQLSQYSLSLRYQEIRKCAYCHEILWREQRRKHPLAKFRAINNFFFCVKCNYGEHTRCHHSAFNFNRIYLENSVFRIIIRRDELLPCCDTM